MLYAEARPLIASGDLLAFSNPRFVSRLIRTWTGGSYSHVGIAWRLGLPYSYADCARVALGRAPRRDDEVCSVYAASILRIAGLDLPLPSYTPAALVAALMERDAMMRCILPDPLPLAA